MMPLFGKDYTLQIRRILDTLLGLSRTTDAVTRTLAEQGRQHDQQRESLARLEGKLDKLMATLADLDAALSTFETASEAADAADAAATAEIQAAVNDILVHVNPAVDVSAQVARVAAAQQKRTDAAAKLKTAADAIQALDVQPTPGPTPVPTPDPTPTPATRR